MKLNTTKIWGLRTGLCLVFLLQFGLFQDLFAAKTGNWLTVEFSLDQVKANKEGITYQGFTVMLMIENQWRSKELSIPANSSATMISTEFDLGQHETVDVLKVVWPTAELQIMNAIQANQVITLEKPDFPIPPSNVFARVTDPTKIDLVWKDNSHNELGFSIERSQYEDKGFVEIGKVAANQNYFTDLNVEKNKTYFYRVRAISEAGMSLFDGAYQKTEANTGLVLEDVNQPIRMYPNPSQEFLDVRVNNDVMGQVIVRFVDNQGKELKSVTINKQIKDLKTKVDISTLPYGMYMVEISLVTQQSLFKSS